MVEKEREMVPKLVWKPLRMKPVRMSLRKPRKDRRAKERARAEKAGKAVQLFWTWIKMASCCKQLIPARLFTTSKMMAGVTRWDGPQEETVFSLTIKMATGLSQERPNSVSSSTSMGLKRILKV